MVRENPFPIFELAPFDYFYALYLFDWNFKSYQILSSFLSLQLLLQDTYVFYSLRTIHNHHDFCKFCLLPLNHDILFYVLCHVRLLYRDSLFQTKVFIGFFAIYTVIRFFCKFPVWTVLAFRWHFVNVIHSFALPPCLL